MKRYDIADYENGMTEQPNGGWVAYDDVTALTQQLAEAKEAIKDYYGKADEASRRYAVAWQRADAAEAELNVTVKLFRNSEEERARLTEFLNTARQQLTEAKRYCDVFEESRKSLHKTAIELHAERDRLAAELAAVRETLAEYVVAYTANYEATYTNQQANEIAASRYEDAEERLRDWADKLPAQPQPTGKVLVVAPDPDTPGVRRPRHIVVRGNDEQAGPATATDSPLEQDT